MRRANGWWPRRRRRWPAPTATRIPSYAALRGALSERYGIARQRIALGNGSCDILLAAGEALLEPGAEVVYAWPAFSVYPHLAAASGARGIQVPLDSEDRHDLEAMAAEITVATRLVLICNPNNPTSTSLALDEVEAFLQSRPAPRVRDPRRGLLRVRLGPRRHLRLARAPAALAQPRPAADVLEGLRPRRAAGRLRPCAGTSGFRAAVDQVRQPFYLNIAAQAAAVEALRHQDEVERRVTRTVAARIELSEGLRELGLWVAESDANFVWTHLPEDAVEADVVSGLAERGVLVRAGAALGREGSLRVTVGSDADNARFLSAIAELV